MRLFAALVLCAALICAVLADFPCGYSPGKCYLFANVKFDQDGTFDEYTPLAPGIYHGSTASLQPAVITRLPSLAGTQLWSTFPDPGTADADFNGLKSVGSVAQNLAVPLTDTDPTQVRNLVLGTGVYGAISQADRAGIHLKYDLRGLQNLAGPDFVVFTVNELFRPGVGMAQVFVSNKGWSDWVYVPPTFSSPLDGTLAGFATLFDLDDFGVTPNSVQSFITEMRYANLAETDRVLNSSGMGTVLPQDDGSTKPVHYPQAPAIANYGTLGKDTFAPTILYVAAIHETLSLEVSNLCWADDEDCDDDDDETSHVHGVSVGRNKQRLHKQKPNTKSEPNTANSGKQESAQQQPTSVKGPIASFHKKAVADFKRKMHADK